jgi:hypothetical protein
MDKSDAYNNYFTEMEDRNDEDFDRSLISDGAFTFKEYQGFIVENGLIKDFEDYIMNNKIKYPVDEDTKENEEELPFAKIRKDYSKGEL